MVHVDVKHHVYILILPSNLTGYLTCPVGCSSSAAPIQKLCDLNCVGQELQNCRVPRICAGDRHAGGMQNKGPAVESRQDQEEGGELDSHEEVRHFCGSRRDQEEGGGAGP